MTTRTLPRPTVSRKKSSNSKTVGIALLVATLLSSIVASANAQERRRDGNWWRDTSDDTRLLYMLGMFDGIEAVHMKATAEEPHGTAIFTEKMMQTIGRPDCGQAKDAVDAFYQDAKNRNIPVEQAIWIVFAGISGVPKDQLEEKTRQLRVLSH